MKALKIMIVMLALVMSVGVVCAAENIADDAIGDDSKEILETVHEDVATDEGSDILETAQNDIYTAGDDSFTNLTDEIEENDVVVLTHDYSFNNVTDNKKGIVIAKDNLVLNGNGRTIDAKNQSRIFNITANNVIINDLILMNGNAQRGGAIYSTGSLTLNNVTFINNYATAHGGAIELYGGATVNCDNSRFIDNYADIGSSICVEMKSKLNLYNSNITSKIFNRYSQIAALIASTIYVENATFFNTSSSYAPACYIDNSNASMIRSRFINLRANVTAGAIGTKPKAVLYVEKCEFINTSSFKNGGAIFADVADFNIGRGNLTIIDTVFKDTSSGFGGACLLLGGKLLLKNTKFINTHATYNGGSVYISFAGSDIINCTFDSGSVEFFEDYPTYGGAICGVVSGRMNIKESKFFNNKASAGSAIYLYQTSHNIDISLFENNTNPIYSVFTVESSIGKNNTFINDDNVSTNNTFFETIITGQGLQLTLLNNTIDVAALPSRFDLRDWGWTSPVRNQGMMGSCWTFGMTGALESALLKAAGITTDFSENNMQDIMLRYSIYGDNRMDEGGINSVAAGYLLSWLGAFSQDEDTYDEMGKVSPLITTGHKIHIQDVMFISNNEIHNGTQLKSAIMKYGSLDVSFCSDKKFYNNETYAYYVHGENMPDHTVSIVGWDDNFPKEKFLTPPPGDGAWIVKNSWGSQWGENGYFYISYYDKSLLNDISDPGGIGCYAVAIIIENTEPYNKNYQYDLEWAGDFLQGQSNASYCNVFESLDDDLIAAVGTYFNQSGVDYTVEIFVNDELKLTQNGVSKYFGYHTIKLNDYIPIKKGDIFKAKITSNAIPVVYESCSNVHYSGNISFISTDGVNWQDGHKLDSLACLKVYTVADDTKIINNKNIAVDYSGGSYFNVKVVTSDGHSVGAGAVVNIIINGKTNKVKTDKNGIAKIKITEGPGKYTVKTTYNGKTVKNTVTVKHVLTASKGTVKKTAKKLTLKATLKINGKLVKGKQITFKFNGKTYKVKTNSKGVAQKTLNQKVINKLKKGKKYTVKVTYKKDTIKTTVQVK